MNERAWCGWVLSVWIGSLCGGCAGQEDPAASTASGPRPDAMLVDMAAWEEGDETLAPDPFVSHRPDGVELGCPIGSVVLEGASLEIRTGTCPYVWLQQPLDADLKRGDPLEIVYWHSALIAEPPAVGHFALAIGDRTLFERNIEIPSDPAAYTETLTSPLDADVGEIISLHLHNHGTNDWNFLRVERVTAP